MTYNPGFIVVICFGLTIGQFIFFREPSLAATSGDGCCAQNV